MILLKIIKNKQGAITPFMVIVLAAFVWVFTVTYSHYLAQSQALYQRHVLLVASNDLLSGFDARLLKDYGLLAYSPKDASDQIEASIMYNIDGNGKSPFLKSKEEIQLATVGYEAIETLSNRQALAEICVEVSKIHVPMAAMTEIATLYQWREQVEKKAKAYEKVNSVMKKMQALQADVRDYYGYIEKINTLGGHKVSWYESTDSGRAGYALGALSKKHEESIEILKAFKSKLNRVKQDFEAMEDIEDIQLESLLASISLDMETYEVYFSEDDTIEELIEQLEENKIKIKEILDDEDYGTVGKLETNFWTADIKENQDWINLLSTLEEAIGGFAVGDNILGDDFGEKQDPDIRVALSVVDHQLLNEYFLAVLKTKVAVTTRDFPILTRDDRRSEFDNGEVEYLLTGIKNSDWLMKTKLFGLRMASNVIYLLSHKDKYNLAKTGGYAMGGWFPGGGAIGTVALLTGWSGIESVRDVQCLYDGQGIPFVKTDTSWFYDIDLDSFRIGQSKGYSDGDKTTEIKSQFYNDYLRLLLMMTPADKKITRYTALVSENLSASKTFTCRVQDLVIKHRLEWQDHQLEGGYYE